MVKVAARQGVTALLIAIGSGVIPVASAAPESLGPIRACIAELSVPPYLSGDPYHPGIMERLKLDAGKLVGLSTQLTRYPTRRCYSMAENGDADVVIAVPAPAVMGYLQFPMKAGNVDTNKRLATLRMVLVRRSETPFEWDGKKLVGAEPGNVLVGTRIGARAAIDQLEAKGFKVDQTAVNASVLLKKLALKRVDLVLSLQDELDVVLKEPGFQSLVVLPTPWSSIDFYAATRKGLSPELQERVEAWWTAISLLRQQPEYRPN